MPIELKSGYSEIKKPISLSNNEEQSDDIHMAASGNYVYVVWKDSTGDQDWPFKAYFARSTDGGGSFGQPIELKTNGRSYNFHMLVQDERVYLLWSDKGGLYFERSTDFGTSFSDPAKITAAEISDFKLAGNNENVYISWTAPGVDEDPDDYITSTDLFFTQSKDFGATFAKEVNLTRSSSYSFGHDLAADGDSVYITSDEGRMLENKSGTFWLYSVYFTKSDDNGKSFSDVRTIPNSTSSYGQESQIAVSVDSVFIAWTSEYPGGQSILLSRSSNRGNTFEKPVQVSQNERYPTLNQVIAADDGHIYLLWKSYSSDYDKAWFSFVQSSNNGQTFAQPVVFRNEVGSDSFPSMATMENGLHAFIVWNGARINKGDVGPLLGSGLYYASSDNWGAFFKPVVQLNSQNDDIVYQPLVDTNNRDVFIVWNHFWHDGGSDPRLAKITVNLPPSCDFCSDYPMPLTIQEIRFYKYDSEHGTNPDYHADESAIGRVQVNSEVIINSLVVNYNHAGEHFDLITEVMDKDGLVVYLTVRHGVAVPYGHQIPIDSAAPLIFNQTGSYVVESFAVHDLQKDPNLLSLAEVRSIEVVYESS